MEQAGVVFGVLAVIVIMVSSMIWRGSRSESMLQKWARENGFTLLSEERRTFFKGPFFWTSGKGQMVFYVAVRDAAGHIRHAWIRCGGYFLGMISDHMDVEWD
jgi:hypothetical protein